MHKALAKTVAAAVGVAVLPTVTLPTCDGDVSTTQTITSTITFPLILKPLSVGREAALHGPRSSARQARPGGVPRE
ncbi:hypothetical protein [Streptomyces alanosinicus]|uniref:Uncharacterized protein n=1 Tax=Streptomyces alanosinicus TaxID=68171 RepID=A0A918YNV9_9ACTN|nr:hypothetical protein [Streptomyces alanosinicus]GHE10999.1 hypothetical protein GCM10010339_69050 [Streptomyces alanosinicus]